MLDLDYNVRRYVKSDCATFFKTKEHNGGLSNMCAGFPLVVGEVNDIRTTEALYQACRFPTEPELQRAIIAERSPMSAKMKAKANEELTRPDWMDVRVDVMFWCLQLKLVQNRHNFYPLLESTGDLDIVEISRKDAFWGALPEGDYFLSGVNILGKLLMRLRQGLKERPEPVQPLKIDNFLLYGQQIGVQQ